MTKILPHSVDTERALVSLCAIYGGDAEISQVEGMVRAEHFHDQRHEAIWRAMEAIHGHGRPVDQFTLRDELVNTGRLATAGGDDYILGLWDAAPLRRPEQHARTIRDYADRRAMIATLTELVAEGYESATKSREWMESVGARVSSLAAEATQVEVSDAQESLLRFWQRSVRIQEAGGLLGYRSGIPSLDAIIGGFWADQLTVLGGRPSAGKSALLETCAVNVLEQGARPLYVSVEMSEGLMWPRILAKKCGINATSIRDQQLTADGFAALHQAMVWFKKSALRLVARSGLTIGELRSIVRRERQKHGVDIIFVDYIQRVRPTTKQERRDLEIGEVSNGLADLGRELEMPVVAGAQVNRQVANRADKRPMTSDLRESGSIENDSDTIVLIHREAQYEKTAKQERGHTEATEPSAYDEGAAELIVGKNRNGDIGIAHTRYRAELCQFGDHL